MHRLTRRAFLEIAGRQSIAAGLAANFLLLSCGSSREEASALGLDREATQDLIRLIDEIIPAGEGLPAASQAGTLAYFELLATRDEGLARTVRDSLAAIAGGPAGGRGLAALSRDEAERAVQGFADGSPDLFAAMRTYVYEGYYLQPRVWQVLGYQPYPTSAPGPAMDPFDPATLDRVRAMPQRWQEV